METCTNCGNRFEGKDCPHCMTITGIDISKIASVAIITSRIPLAPGEEPPAALEDVASSAIYPVTLPMCKFGRDSQNDLVVSGPNNVSRIHFVISFEDGYFYLMDLSSKNGTALNGKPLSERTVLVQGDVIQVGNMRFRFTVNAEVDANGGYSSFLRYLQDHHTEETSERTFDMNMTCDDEMMPEENREEIKKILANLDQSYTLAEIKESLEEPKHKPKSPKERRREPDPDPFEPDPSAVTRDLEPVVEPAWCKGYVVPELQHLETEINDLKEVVRNAQNKIRDGEHRIAFFSALRKALLVDSGPELNDACSNVFKALGWSVNTSDQELSLLREGDMQALVRIVTADRDVAHLDLGKLVISQVAHWCQHRLEPKGILVVASAGERPCSPEVAFNNDLQQYARQKNVCLLTSLQLLCIYKDVTLGETDREAVRGSVLSTSGKLPGYHLEAIESAQAVS